MPNDAHDALVKAIFERPENAAGLLAELLPADVAAMIDWKRLTLNPGSFVDRELMKSHSDLLFSTYTTTGEEALIYVLVEHQRTLHKLMPFRALCYEVRILQRWVQQHPDSHRLPLIFSILLQQHRAPETTASLSDLFHATSTLSRSSRQHLPELRLIVMNLPRTDDALLLQSGMTEAAKLALLVLKHAPSSRDFLARFRRWMAVVRSLLELPDGRDVLSQLLRYIQEVSEYVEITELEQLITIEVENRGANVMATIAQKLRLEAQRDLMLHQLMFRFGELPAEAIERVKGATVEELFSWSELVLTSQTLEEVFAS
jgi:Putative transposase, YhgA-like